MNATVPFSRLLERTVRLCGMDPARLRSELAESFASWLEDRVGEAWRATIWPETCLLEERTVETDPAEDDAYEIALSAPVGEVLAVFGHDPRKFDAPGEVGFLHWTGDVVRLTTATPQTVWVRYRMAPPRFTAEPWSSSAAYAADDVIYFAADGHCYLVRQATNAGESPATHPARYAVQRIPEVLAGYAQRAARADWLGDDGQDDKAARQLVLAEQWLTGRMADLFILRPHAGHYSLGSQQRFGGGASAGAPAGETSYLVTDTGDTLVTDAGDPLIHY